MVMNPTIRLVPPLSHQPLQTLPPIRHRPIRTLLSRPPTRPLPTLSTIPPLFPWYHLMNPHEPILRFVATALPPATPASPQLPTRRP